MPQMQAKTFSHSIILPECFPMGEITFIEGIPSIKNVWFCYKFHFYLLCKYNEPQQNMFHMFHPTIFPEKVFVKDW